MLLDCVWFFMMILTQEPVFSKRGTPPQFTTPLRWVCRGPDPLSLKIEKFTWRLAPATISTFNWNWKRSYQSQKPCFFAAMALGDIWISFVWVEAIWVFVSEACQDLGCFDKRSEFYDRVEWKLYLHIYVHMIAWLYRDIGLHYDYASLQSIIRVLVAGQVMSCQRFILFCFRIM